MYFTSGSTSVQVCQTVDGCEQDFVTKIAEGSRRGGAGAPLRASNGQVQARLPISFARNDFGGRCVNTMA